MNEVTVTLENFKTEVLESEKPVLVDFWAPWCGPCRMLSSVISEIAEFHPEIKVCKINVDEQNDLAQQFNVMSIPYIAVFKNGKITYSTIGFQTTEKIMEMLNK